MTQRIFHAGMMIMGIAMLSACTQTANPPLIPSSPNCAFAKCPVSSSPSSTEGILQGTMTIGPICPVERVGHPCTPTPVMYAAHTVMVFSANKAKIIATMTPDAQGKFSAMLPAGTYLVDVEHQAVGAVRGVPVVITVRSGLTVTLSIDIDTGIR